MASEGDDKESAGEERAPRECMACRGSGSVVSNLGGTPKTVTCPWCRGTGMRIADNDAQSGWAEQQGAEPDTQAGEAAAAAEGGGEPEATDEGEAGNGGDTGGAAA